MNTVIKVENVGKQYRLGQVGTGTISHDLNRAWYRMRGKEDPYLKVGVVNDRSVKGGSDLVWALKDINFEVKQGEVLGIIGKNGAGKSTLLKILSQVTTPTTGEIKVKGRIAALLEVGTGFHPELTGRENVFLNGAILGMTKAEIKSKFDEIIDFSGVEKYIDTPVKRYSSGMMVRLGFAVAAHLEPEILIVDEVLAVGDAEFQKKCLGKMKDVAGQGRTVLFVSHNLGAIQNLCDKGIVIQNGEIVYKGDIKNAVNAYLNQSLETISLNRKWNKDERPGNENIKINNISLMPIEGNKLTIGSGISFDLSFNNYIGNINIAFGFTVYGLDDTKIFESGIIISSENNSEIGLYKLNGKLNPFILNAGVYKIKIVFGQNQQYVLFKHENIIQFEIEDTFFDRGVNFSPVSGICRPNLNWIYNIENND